MDEKAIPIAKTTYGEDHPKIAIRWNNLGAAWDNKGEYDKAIEYYEKALEIDLKNYEIYTLAISAKPLKWLFS